MKINKTIISILAGVLTCSMLTGCVGMLGDITVNEDGSGKVSIQAGISKNAMDMMGEEITEEDVVFEYNGIEYVGEYETYEFSSLDEFVKILNENSEDESTGMTAGNFDLEMDESGAYILTLTVDNKTASTENMEAQIETTGIEKGLEYMLASEMAMNMTFNLPYEIKQLSGTNAGITINGNTITIDMLKVTEDTDGQTDVLTFVSENDADNRMFMDVNKKNWFYEAVNSMAKDGLVNGIGNGAFAPQDTLTYAQFCQILATAQGLETGDVNGYWAYKAIESCRNKGYIIDLGTYTSENYDVPITREAAVAGIFRAKATELIASGKVKTDFTNKNIPDYDVIDYNYRNDILNAYNSGITSGIDDSMTFNPKGILTRAEVCQLFYNLDWTASENVKEF